MSNKIAVLKREEGIGRPLDLSHANVRIEGLRRRSSQEENDAEE
jgi:hypothetical protein